MSTTYLSALSYRGTLLGDFFRTKINKCATLFKIQGVYTYDTKSSHQ